MTIDYSQSQTRVPVRRVPFVSARTKLRRAQRWHDLVTTTLALIALAVCILAAGYVHYGGQL